MKNNHENDVLLTALEADAMAQSSRIIKAAQDAAAEMLSQAGIEIKTLETKRVEAIRAGLERDAVVRLSGARLNAKAAGLQVRQDVIDEVFVSVTARVDELAHDEYAALIRGLYEELKAGWTLDEPFIVHVNQKDAGLLVDSGVEVRLDETIKHGAVFSTKDGRIRHENTVASRIKMMRPNLMPVINKILFSDSAARRD